MVDKNRRTCLSMSSSKYRWILNLVSWQKNFINKQKFEKSMAKNLLIKTINSLVIFFIGSSFVNSSPQTGVVVPSPNEEIESPSKQVIVQHPITINVDDSTPLITHPSPAPLKTRVVVVHNNMVPVPIECFQPPDSGTCSKDLARIYYDHETRTCKPFSYTGCGGNANRFQSIKNCYRICHPYRHKIRPKLANKKSEDLLSRAGVLEAKTTPTSPSAMISVRSESEEYSSNKLTGGPYARPIGAHLGGSPPAPPPPYFSYRRPPGYPYPQLLYPSHYRYLAPPPRLRHIQMSHPIIQKQLVRSSDGIHIQEKLVGESLNSIPHNSGKIVLKDFSKK